MSSMCMIKIPNLDFFESPRVPVLRGSPTLSLAEPLKPPAARVQSPFSSPRLISVYLNQTPSLDVRRPPPEFREPYSTVPVPAVPAPPVPALPVAALPSTPVEVVKSVPLPPRRVSRVTIPWRRPQRRFPPLSPPSRLVDTTGLALYPANGPLARWLTIRERTLRSRRLPYRPIEIVTTV